VKPTWHGTVKSGVLSGSRIGRQAVLAAKPLRRARAQCHCATPSCLGPNPKSQPMCKCTISPSNYLSRLGNQIALPSCHVGAWAADQTIGRRDAPKTHARTASVVVVVVCRAHVLLDTDTDLAVLGPCLLPKKFCKIFQIPRHIEFLDTYMKY